MIGLIASFGSRLGLLVAEQTARVGLFTLLGRAALLTLIGLLAVPVSIFLLWINEGLPDRATLAETAIVIDADPASRPSGLATLHGPLTASQPVGDELFFEPGPFVQVDRVVELLAWHEVITATETRRWGGWRDREEQVEYVLAWTWMPPDSAAFRDPSRRNPPLPLETQRTYATGLAIAGQRLTDTLTVPLPGARRLLLDEVTLRDRGLRETRTGSMFYLDGADPSEPEAGDVRVRFVVHDTQQPVTWFGAATRAGLTAWTKKGVVMHELFAGERAAAVEQLRVEDRLRLVLIRLGGVLLLWGGLFLIGSFTFALLDIAPPVGFGVRVVWAALTLPVAGTLGFGTIAVSVVGHDWRATAAVLGGLLLVIVVLFYVVPRFMPADRRRRDGPRSPAPP